MKKGMRHKNWDYSTYGVYMVTISVTHQAKPLSEIENNKTVLTDAGEVVKREWESLPSIYPFITLGEFVVMPNHFHGVIYFTTRKLSNATNGNVFEPQRSNLPAVMRRFKSGSTRKIKLLGIDFRWHKSYHDTIINSPETMRNIVSYIRQNPAKHQQL